MLYITLCLAIGLIVLGAANGKAPGWVAVGCGALAILSAALHWPI